MRGLSPPHASASFGHGALSSPACDPDPARCQPGPLDRRDPVALGRRARKIHGLRDFFSQIIVATGLWLPLAALFIGRGFSVMFELADPWLRRTFRLLPRPSETTLLSPGRNHLVRALCAHLHHPGHHHCRRNAGGPDQYTRRLHSSGCAQTAIDFAFQAFAEAIHAAWIKAKSERAGA